MRPVLDELIWQAAQGRVMHNDDTGMRILQLVREPGDFLLRFSRVASSAS